MCYIPSFVSDVFGYETTEYRPKIFSNNNMSFTGHISINNNPFDFLFHKHGKDRPLILHTFFQVKKFM